MNRKKLEDLEFDELVIEATWDVMESLIQGTPLKTSVRSAMSKTLQWRELKDKKKEN